MTKGMDSMMCLCMRLCKFVPLVRVHRCRWACTLPTNRSGCFKVYVMANNKKILKRIHVVGYTKKITQAMRMVSVAKMSKLKRMGMALQPYREGLENLFLRTIQTDSAQVLGSFLAKRAVRRTLCLVITSDRGLCGAYNNHVLQALRHYQATCQQMKRDVTFLPIGKKGHQYLKTHGIAQDDTYVNMGEVLTFESVQRLSRHLLHLFGSNQYQKIGLLYEGSTQGLPIEIKPFLPCVLPKVTQEDDLTIYEPDANRILRQVMIQVMETRLYQHLLQAQTTEHKSRILAMGQSTDNAEELLKQLKIAHNRIRKSSVTRDLIEITAGVTVSSAS